MLDYQDLLPILALGRTGSLAAAAREIGVDHSTMFRRLGAIERKLGVSLFDRSRKGYRPTGAGSIILEFAARFEDEISELELAVAGQDLKLEGPLRITTTNTLNDLLVPICVAFAERFPMVSVELHIGNEFLDLSRREADIAVRPTTRPPEDLHGRRMGRMTFSVFGKVGHEVLTDSDLARERWVGFADNLSHILAYEWMRSHVPRGNIVFRSSSMVAVAAAAATGAGIAVLPCHYGDAHPDLVRLYGPLPDVATDFWLLVHDNMRGVARVRAFTDFAFTEFKRLRATIEKD